MDKQSIREAVWEDLEASGVARFPFPPTDRIPNFAGADEAAERLAERPAWEGAGTVKSNPDAPQLPVRRQALRDEITVFVAQPRLRDADPFLRLEPGEIADIGDATTVSGISTHGAAVGPDNVPVVDLIVAGSVAVGSDGQRIGKGEGYSDLEWGMLAELGAVTEETTVATTVHERQVLDGQPGISADMPEPEPHDVPLDLIVTPERTIQTNTQYDQPAGVDWNRLPTDRLDEIPVLAELAPEDR
ncbi:MAG: 5-formyltetrahydrofolate cyclo-ligase [uncultured archaeon A07HR60]|nr:MAG: 5-formyltetrahydrofolate cyclo-ligase [uncultured archaeon A07HR60]